MSESVELLHGADAGDSFHTRWINICLHSISNPITASWKNRYYRNGNLLEHCFCLFLTDQNRRVGFVR